MKQSLLALTLFISLSTYANIPIIYQTVANNHGVSVEQLYQVLIKRTGRVGQSKQITPWPWTVMVNGSQYQFKTRIEMFHWLTIHQAKSYEKITFGFADQPLLGQSRERLWRQLEISDMLDRVATDLALQRKHINKNLQIKPTIKQGINEPFQPLVAQVAQEVGIDPLLIHAVMMQESRGKKFARSRKGAMGLMQLMPATAASMGLAPHEYYQPLANIRGGARYLKQQLQDFGRLDLALAAYNAGPNAVRKYGGIPPYRETKNYVNRVQERYKTLQKQSRKLAQSQVNTIRVIK